MLKRSQLPRQKPKHETRTDQLLMMLPSGFSITRFSAVKKRHGVFHNAKAHGLPRFGCSAAEMGEEDDIVHRQERIGNLRLLLEHIKASTGYRI